MQRLWTRRDGLAAALVLAAAPPAIATSMPRIVAVGDLHGDFSAWRDIARAAQLIDENGDWIGTGTILVQMGDVVDRGPDSLKIIEDLMHLQQQAAHGQGQVVALVGNHEAMNMTGDLRYVSVGDYAAFVRPESESLRRAVFDANRATIIAYYRQRNSQLTDNAIRSAWYEATPLGSIEHRKAWRPDGRIGRWVINNPVIVLIDSTLFVHAGISPAYTRLSIVTINLRVGQDLRAQATDSKAMINDPVGPLWYRGLAAPFEQKAVGTSEPFDPTSPPEPPVEDQLTQLLSAYDAKRIVIGHTPIVSGIAELYGERLICIDTGISNVYGGPLSYLEILEGRILPHAVERSASSMTKGVP